MDIVAKINENNSFGGNFYTKDIQEDWNITDVVYDSKFLKPIWNNSKWEEGATQEEIEDYNRSLVPEEISRMKFEMQVLLTTGIEWDGIIAYIIDLSMSEFYKKLLLIRLKRCVTLKREDNDLNTIAAMMGITQQQLDEIFINGNLLN